MSEANAYARSVFLEQAGRLRALSAPSVIDRLAIRFEGGSDQALEVTLTAPDDEATIAFFAKVRAFGTPGKLVHVQPFIDALGATAAGRRQVVVEHLRESYEDLGVVSHEWHKAVLGPDATPRQVWELWTYADVLHEDRAKREIWEALDPFLQDMGRYVAYAYAADLYHLVTVVEAMLRDPRVDDRQVNMQVLAPRPDFPVPKELAGFRAARVRLRPGALTP